MTWNVRIGINPLSWMNDDLPSLGGETPLETALSEGREIGYAGFELGNKFPKDGPGLKAKLDEFGLVCVSGWYSGFLAEVPAGQTDAQAVAAEIERAQAHLRKLQYNGVKVVVYGECAGTIQGQIDTPVEKYLLCLGILCVIALAAKNLVRSAIGREWMAIRDMDVAAAVIGIRPMYAKLSAFGVSSFIVGIAGALWAFVHLGAWEPAAFSIDRSFQLLFMIIIGGLGSIVGSFMGAAFFVLLPLLLNYVPHWLGLPLSTATATYLEHMIFGALIVFFLIVEPHGLARLWSTFRQKLRIWPFPH